MEAGNNKESMAASDSNVDEAVSSPGTDDHAAAAAAGAGDEDVAAAPLSSPAATTAAPGGNSSTRPYYECVFCKRGFTTAQALGGHMNIHRRDRAKPGAARDASTPSAGITSVSRNVECYSQYRHLAYPPAAMPVVSSGAGAGGSGGSSSFAMYYGGAAGVDVPAAVGPRELSLFDAATTTRDHCLHLGVRRDGVGEAPAPEGSEQHAGELPPERELDLELRLGRHTKH